MHVIVVDANPVGRKLMRKILDNCPGHDVIGEADGIESALDIARQENPDVVILANTLMSDEWRDVTGIIADTEAAIVLVAGACTGPMVWRGMSAGASGYVLKDGLANDLPQALVAAEAGGAFVSAPLTKQLIGYIADRFEVEHEGLSAADISQLLLPRERETLLRLAGGESTEEIAAGMFVTSATVRAYVSRILRKLGLRSRGEAIALAYRSRFYSGSA